jgi:competence protein ComEA
MPWAVIVMVAGLLLAGQLLAMTACRGASEVVVLTAVPLPTPGGANPSSTPDAVRVQVEGAVRQPGHYVLPPGSLVDAAVQAAGGPAADADLVQVNLARVLQDGAHVRIPRVGEILPTATPVGLSPDGRIDINRAGVDLLTTLPRIGPTIAQRIVDYRELEGAFETVEEIQEVRGIGPATFEQIKDLITAGTQP